MVALSSKENLNLKESFNNVEWTLKKVENIN